MVVEIKLELGKVAEDNMLIFDRQILRQNIVRPAMMNLFTIPDNSANRSSPFFRSSSVPAASRPFRIGISNLFRNSFCEPSRFGLAKWRRAKYSERSFWMGVPDKITRRVTFRLFKAVHVKLSLFLRRWPSSHKRSPIGLSFNASTYIRRVSYETMRTGRTTARPDAMAHCFIWEVSSAFEALPSIANGVIASFPSHFTAYVSISD